mmetsp:Transcript_23561/g.82016  ORF Transcript_23561/g.82016 Transcript_23561/m.82016 type:complete len:235 (-) Transcript_23561:2295-2999(-)
MPAHTGAGPVACAHTNRPCTRWTLEAPVGEAYDGVDARERKRGGQAVRLARRTAVLVGLATGYRRTRGALRTSAREYSGRSQIRHRTPRSSATTAAAPTSPAHAATATEARTPDATASRLRESTATPRPAASSIHHGFSHCARGAVDRVRRGVRRARIVRSTEVQGPSVELVGVDFEARGRALERHHHLGHTLLFVHGSRGRRFGGVATNLVRRRRAETYGEPNLRVAHRRLFE